METPVIRGRALTKRFGDTLAVDSVDLDVWPGEIVSILGTSGCGKTTLLRLIAGFETPTSGSVRILGAEMSGESRFAPPNDRGIGMVVQEYALFPHMTVERNIAFGLQDLDDSRRAERVAEVLELVRLAGYGRRFPYELSGGQQQRVALARTLAPNPAAALLDEPFSNLDSSMRQRLRAEVEGILRSHRMSAIFVTHDREEAFAMADRVGVMVDGQLLQIGAPDHIYHYPASPEIAGLTGACDFVSGKMRRDGSVVTPLGVLNCVVAGQLAPNGPVSVLLHPDDIELIPDQGGQGTVVSREFRGDEVVLRVRLDSGESVRSRRRSFSRLPAGSRVKVVPVKTIPFAAYPR
ncbi:MAG: ABC transporter ATP-binding protein [Dehalococcoidia bacterium]|nr:ABC transporter ATP-binding protein [Dehalococcoidia bacterium]